MWLHVFITNFRSTEMYSLCRLIIWTSIRIRPWHECREVDCESLCPPSHRSTTRQRKMGWRLSPYQNPSPFRQPVENSKCWKLEMGTSYFSKQHSAAIQHAAQLFIQSAFSSQATQYMWPSSLWLQLKWAHILLLRNTSPRIGSNFRPTLWVGGNILRKMTT